MEKIMFYQAVATGMCDEWTLYEGYDVDAAIKAARDNYHHLTNREKTKQFTEVRGFMLSKRWEDMDDNEQCEIINQGYFPVKWELGV